MTTVAEFVPAGARRPRVVIVSASVGVGHDGAAHQLATALTALGCDVTQHDFLNFLPGTSGAWLNRLYAAQLRFLPGSWGALLALLRQPRLTALAGATVAKAAQEGTRAVLTGGEDLIISTYPLASQVLGRLRADGVIAAPVVTFLCDMSVHPLWVAPGVDRHIALHPAAAAQALRSGARGISACAPLVDPAFRPATAAERAATRVRRGLPTGPIALVLGGSWGVGQLDRTARDIAASGLATPVTICGRNESLRRKLLADGVGIPLGWVEDMASLIPAADVVIHNAGGLSCLEALAAGVPLITYRSLPGHGSTNAAVLRDTGMAPWPRSRSALHDALRAALRTVNLPATSGTPSPIDVLYGMLVPAHPALAGVS
jgi:UDP-N-acetylglucosamine:LPS N-acetylglucosamine transferase